MRRSTPSRKPSEISLKMFGGTNYMSLTVRVHSQPKSEDIRTTAHSPKGDKAHPRHSVEDERTSNVVRHIPIGWGNERDVTGHYPVFSLNPHETQ